jgi:superfamily I DNA/RNA helicase
LSPLQWRAVYTFFRDAEELYVAGDPNQALYGFAGAAVNYMLEMKCDETIVLDKSHRCSIPVMRMAEKVWNRMEAKAALPSDNGSDNGFAVFYPQCDIRRMFLNPILASVEKGYKVMVLANTHERLYAIKKAFGTKNWEFPCSFYSGRKKFRWKNGRAATLSTIHQAKGLEADYVLIDASCGRSAEKNEFGRRHERWQDYWRVIYTAITRAKRGVVVFEMSKNHLVGEPSCMEELYYAKFNYERYERWVTQTPAGARGSMR